MRSSSSRSMGAEIAHLEARHGDPLEQHEVERNAGDLACREADGHEPAAVVQRPQRRLRQGAAHRVDDGIGAVRQETLQRRTEVARRVVHQPGGPVGLRHVELRRRRRDGGDGRTQHDTELHGRQADSPAGAEHDQLVPGTDPGERAERVVGGAMGNAERCGVARLDPLGDPGQRRRRDHDLLCERPHHRAPEDAVAHRHVAHVVGHLEDFAGELAPGYERHGNGELVLVRDQEDVGIIDGCGRHPDPCRPRLGRRRRHILYLHDLRRAVGRADGGAHPQITGRSPSSRPARPPPSWCRR